MSGPPSLVGALRERARLDPRRVALVERERRLSYGELAQAVERVARALRAAGVGAEEPVIVVAGHAADTVVALFGILAAGAAYLPVDERIPAERLRFIAQDAGARVVLCAGPDAAVPGARSVDELLRSAPAAGAEPLPADPHPDRLAYVMYTSGTTGTPKGVEISHRALSTFVHDSIARFRFCAEDVVTHLASVSFDISLWEIVPTIAVGATLVVAPERDVLLPDKLAEWYRAAGVTVGYVPTALAPIVTEELAEREDLRLRLLMVGGEALQRWPSTAFGPEFVNGYGPTETTIFASASPAGEAKRHHAETPSIGLPVGEAVFRVLDEQFAEVADGTPGQLFISGTPLGRGYRRRPGLTAEKFVPDPFGPPGTRMYATGDLARRLPDGRFAWLGRIDRQVKLHGYRIEPEEIERVLGAHPAVVHAAIVAIAGRRAGAVERLVAVVERVAGDQTSAEALLEHLRARLPYYMIPAKLTFVANMPLSVNGKVDLRRLSDLPA